jgi:hypothetical protein
VVRTAESPACASKLAHNIFSVQRAHISIFFPAVKQILAEVEEQEAIDNAGAAYNVHLFSYPGCVESASC